MGGRLTLDIGMRLGVRGTKARKERWPSSVHLGTQVELASLLSEDVRLADDLRSYQRLLLQV